MKKKILAIVGVLGLMAALAVPMAALAADTGMTEVSGTVAAAIEVTAPAPASLGSMEIGDNNTLEGGPITVTVNCTSLNWTLGAKEDGGDGNMSGTPGTLLNALKIKGGDQIAYTALSGSDVLLENSGAAAAGQKDISDVNFQQTVEYADQVGTYSINITFTATLD